MNHYPAAHINAIAEEGTKDDAVRYLQKHWNALQDAKAEIDRLTNIMASIVASYDTTVRTVRNETIEECVDVVKRFSLSADDNDPLIKALRGLENKPCR